MEMMEEKRGLGETHLWMPSDDLEPPRRVAPLVWAAIFGVLGIAGAVWGVMRATSGRPGLLIALLGFVILAMGVTSFLGYFVKTPA